LREREQEEATGCDSPNVEAKLHSDTFPRLVIPANYRLVALRLMIPLPMHHHPLNRREQSVALC
jgi:hypothetical protein